MTNDVTVTLKIDADAVWELVVKILRAGIQENLWYELDGKVSPFYWSWEHVFCGEIVTGLADYPFNPGGALIFRDKIDEGQLFLNLEGLRTGVQRLADLCPGQLGALIEGVATDYTAGLFFQYCFFKELRYPLGTAAVQEGE